jgi:hypothetical protein
MPKNQKKPAHEPQFDEHEDALGESCGKRGSEHAREAMYNTAVQDVKSVGRRPVDWIKRELLPGAAGDDRRNWPQRKILKNDPAFLLQSYDRLSSDAHKCTVREARAFDYLNRRHQLAMLAAMNLGTPEFRTAAHASVCLTTLYQTSTLIPHNWKFTRNLNECNNSWACPHCYARLMAKQFRAAERRLAKLQPAYIALLSEECNVALADQELCKSRRSAMRASLQAAAEMLGGTGGLWTVQLGPILGQEQYWDINEAHYENAEELVMRVAVMAYISNTRSSLTKLKAFTEGAQAAPQGVSIDVTPARELGALRAVMVKSRNISTAQVQLKSNSHGLFYWPTMTLCSPLQWHSRFLMTRYQKSVRTWGDWCRRSSPTLRISSKSTTKQRRRELLEEAVPVLIETGYPEVPVPGRVALRELLNKTGINASERDVRWLITQDLQTGRPS